MTQFEFYKSFLFVLELLLAQFMFVCRLKRRKWFVLRAVSGIAACFLFAWLLPAPPSLSSNALYCSLLFLLIFAFTVCVGKFLFRNSWVTIVFCCLAGYTTQHMSYELYNIALNLFSVTATNNFYGSGGFTEIFPNLAVFVLYLFIYAVSYCVIYFCFACKLAENEDVSLKNAFIFLFTVFILIIDILLNAIVVYHPSQGAKLYVVIVGVYNVLCCVVSLYLQFEVALRRKIERNFVTVHEMLERVKKQYALSKENIEIINIKCHDLRHQIREMGVNSALSPGAIKDIANSISIYDSMVKTGNDALDIILTEKSLVCSKEGIFFSCMADGEKLGFIEPSDVYALFGNIVDNAIEAVRRVPQEKRSISLRVKQIGYMLVITSSNYYNNDIIKEDGEIQTMKADKRYHGFGLKSINYICERYGGSVDIKTEGDVFTISLVFFIGRGGEK